MTSPALSAGTAGYRRAMADWGAGDYEGFADALQPAADRALEVAAPTAADVAMDLGCGSGNATIPLAAIAGRTIGVDPAGRLLDVAASRAAKAGREVEWVRANAEALPQPDDAVDLVVSVFAVVFSPQPAHAIDEMLRVLRPGGRIVLTAWSPEGPIGEVGELVRAALAEVAGAPLAGPGPHGVAWHDTASYASLVPGGEDVITVHDATLELRAASGAAWVGVQEQSHPMWLAAREALGDDGAWRDLTRRAADVLDDASGEPDAMAVLSPYRIVELRPDPS